jgi:GNAT superfamily N-acetyltransferase
MIEMGYLRAEERERFAARAGADIRELFDADRLIAWLLCDAEHVAGSACATFFERLPYPDGARHAEVGGVYVEPAYRGHGHASRLVEAVLAEVRAAGVRGTFLRPSPRSKALYARLGFAGLSAAPPSQTSGPGFAQKVPDPASFLCRRRFCP